MSSYSPPLRFYPEHGPDLLLTNNGTQAVRSAPGSSHLYTIHPVSPLRRISIRLRTISSISKDIITVGFTHKPPSDSSQPLYGLKIVSLKTQSQLCGKVAHFYYTTSGKIHFGINGKEKGSRNGRIQTQRPLWGFVNISNVETSIELVNCEGVEWAGEIYNTPFTLHPKCGRNVKIEKNIVSKINRKMTGSYTFSMNPIRIGEIITVKILKLATSIGALTLGLSPYDPAQLDPLPTDILSFAAQNNWTSVTDQTWSFLQNDTISFVLTRANNMRIFRNNNCFLTEVLIDTTSHALWCFFEISNIAKLEITTFYAPEFEEDFELGEVNEWKNEVVIEENEKNRDQLCIVCYEVEIDVAMYPCGHYCLCKSCGKEQWKGLGGGVCPVCRKQIDDILKIYKV